MPRHLVDCIDGGVVPLFVARDLAAAGGMDGMHKIGHAAHFLIGMLIRAACPGARVHLDSVGTVADARPRDGVIVLRKHEVVVRREIGAVLVEDIRVVPQHSRLILDG